jgi:hypothetical protein
MCQGVFERLRVGGCVPSGSMPYSSGRWGNNNTSSRPNSPLYTNLNYNLHMLLVQHAIAAIQEFVPPDSVSEAIGNVKPEIMAALASLGTVRVSNRADVG